MIYTDLYNDVINWTENQEPTFIASIPLFVELAEEMLYRDVKIPPQSKDWTGTSTVSGTNTVSLPADFLNFDYLFVTDSNSNLQPMLDKEIDWIYQAFPAGTPHALPTVYANKANTSLVLGPTPDAIYALVGRYQYVPVSIVNAGSSGTWLGSNAQNALLYGTLCQAYTYMKGSDTPLAQQYLAMYQQSVGLVRKLAEGRERADEYRNPTPRPASIESTT